MAKKKPAMLRIQWVRSFIGCPRGMLRKVAHLVKVEELDGRRAARTAAGASEKSD